MRLSRLRNRSSEEGDQEVMINNDGVMSEFLLLKDMTFRYLSERSQRRKVVQRYTILAFLLGLCAGILIAI